MPQSSEEGKSSYRGRSWIRFGFLNTKKSADAVVVEENELRTDTAEDSQNNEGQNIKMFQIKQGCIASPAISGTGQKQTGRMIETVLNPNNVMRAYRQVVSNKGSAGVDGMNVNELYQYLTNNREGIATELRLGKYLPQPILGVEIPKSNGKTRLLGIPTVMDRLLQQAVGQAIAIKFEIEFEGYSYGFRPNRNAQQAVLKAQGYINSGYQHIVDIDLKNFFDEVDHCILLQLLYRKVKCPLTLRLIRKWLRAPDTNQGQTHQTQKRRATGKPA